MAAIVTLNQDSPSVQYLCKKDKRLTKVISMVGPITYTAVGKEMGRIMLPKIPRQADSLKGSEEICPVPSTATRVILPIYIKQDVSSRRWAAAGKPLPLGGKPLLIAATEYLAGIGVSYLQIVNVGKILF